jgi:hypothetical protein
MTENHDFVLNHYVWEDFEGLHPRTDAIEKPKLARTTGGFGTLMMRRMTNLNLYTPTSEMPGCQCFEEVEYLVHMLSSQQGYAHLGNWSSPLGNWNGKVAGLAATHCTLE